MKCRRRKAAVIAAVLAIAALTCGGIRNGCAVEQEEKEPLVTRTAEKYEVQFGDSLSSITAKYCPEYIDSRKYLYDLQRLNERKSNIYAGEEIMIYVYR